MSLDRIQRALSAPAGDRAEGSSIPVFRLEVFGRKPTLEDILGEKFWLGPSPYGGMTHQEFMDKVTPKEAAVVTADSPARRCSQVTALTLAEQWALKHGDQASSASALTEHEREAARKEVLDALADLERARAAAGLPPK